jgi:hypothetical protein
MDKLVLLESEERLVEKAATAGVDSVHVGNPGGKVGAELEPGDAEAAWGRRLEPGTNSVSGHGFEAGS